MKQCYGIAVWSAVGAVLVAWLLACAALSGGTLRAWYRQVFLPQRAQANTPEEASQSWEPGPMVVVPAGYFLRGTTADQARTLAARFGPHFTVETPQRAVYVSAFAIDRYEVTNRQYGRFLAAMEHSTWRYSHPDAPVDKDYTPTYWHDRRLNGATYPVTGVDWYDAYAYCRWAGKRLPTEAEWEKAARGIDGRQFPWGNIWDATRANNVEWRFSQTIDSARQWLHLLGYLRLEVQQVLTLPVESFPQGASPYGVYDMGGNLWEWCQDAYDKDYYRYAPSHDPPGPVASPYRVLRGGCWSSHRGMIRVAYRNYDVATDRHLEVGFRCAR